MSDLIPKIEGSGHGVLGQIVQPQDLKEDWFNNANYYDWYYSFGHYFKPKRILELGVRYGYSLACMTRGCLDNKGEIEKVYGVDFDGEALKITKKAFQKAFKGVPIELLTQGTHGTTIEHTDGKPVDLVHVDASHSWHVIGELEVAFNMVRSGGTIIIDDVGSFETHSDFITMKKGYLDAFLDEKIYANLIKNQYYLNTYRGTYVITKK